MAAAECPSAAWAGPIVLHVGKFIPPPEAGVEAHIEALLRALQPHTAVGLIAGDSPLDPQARLTLPYPVWACRNWGKLDAVTVSPGVLVQAMWLIRQGQVKLLHVHLPNPWADALAMLAPGDLPIVATWHSDIVRQRRLLALYGPLQRAAIRRYDRIIVATQGHLQSSTQLPRRSGHCQKVRVVPYGLDTEALDIRHARTATLHDLKAWQGDHALIVSVGRHVYYKGYQYLLQALERLRWPAKLVLVGRGPLTAALQQHARELGVQDRVRWLTDASRSDVVAALHACDIFALPSIEPAEAFGLASAEAMACGKPTVVCRLGNGVDWLNQHQRTSLLVAPRDPGALANALDDLIADDQRRALMGQAAQRWIHSAFTTEHMVRGTLAVYQELLG